MGSVFTPAFRSIFLDFVAHSGNDCWPMDYKDPLARGLPKDGALIIFPDGLPAKSAAKIVGLPVAPCHWPGRGTRHETAMSLAANLLQVVVLIRSSTGSIHVLLALDQGRRAFLLNTPMPS